MKKIITYTTSVCLLFGSMSFAQDAAPAAAQSEEIQEVAQNVVQLLQVGSSH